MSKLHSHSPLRSLPVMLWAALTLASCQQLDAEFCANHPQDADCLRQIGPRPDAGVCTVDDQCMSPTPVCDKAHSLCVQCTAARPEACTGTAPVCDGDICRGCAADAECPSQTCLPDGACASPLDVLYVSAAGSNLATCAPGDPCTLARAIALVDGTKTTIRLEPAHYDLVATLLVQFDLHVVGRDAVIDRNASGSGPVVEMVSGAKLALDYVTLQGGDGANGHGIACFGGGQLALREVTVQGNAGTGVIGGSGCLIAISHSQIRNNAGTGVVAMGGSLALSRSQVIANQIGGVASAFGPFDLQNNVIAKNGGPSAGAGAVVLQNLPAGVAAVFAFNTVAQNAAPIGGALAGVSCSQIAAPVAMTSNIVVDNGPGPQVAGANCNWIYSDIAPVPVAGTGNRSADPLFIDSLHNNFHLQFASPARDAADPAAVLAIDLDGDARPQGAARDMGADEIK